jgi:anhydro-N-acetylmuramic acid kinase
MNIKNLYKLSQKTTKTAIGLMSGTSVDGVDAVLLRIQGNGTKTKLKQLHFIDFPFPKGLKETILRNSSINSGNVTEICKLNFLISQIYVNAIKKLCKSAGIPLNKIDFIGSHGQTIHHLPQKEKYFGYPVASTLQIADPAVIAKLTGITTIGDFRTGDVALGGQGAPLVPYFDYIMFHSKKSNRALLNIGGISNITILNKKGKGKDVFAFDTGPGNMMIDLLMKYFFNLEYDKDGKTASSGQVDPLLFSAIKSQDQYLNRKPPKSTGREYYGMEFLLPLLQKFSKLPKQNWIATVTDYTAYAVFTNYQKFIKRETPIEELFLSGGGAKNKYLVNSFGKYFGTLLKIQNVTDLGVSSDAKEAICFAVLANETLSGNCSNIPRVTGASKETILGKICLP